MSFVMLPPLSSLHFDTFQFWCTLSFKIVAELILKCLTLIGTDYAIYFGEGSREGTDHDPCRLDT